MPFHGSPFTSDLSPAARVDELARNRGKQVAIVYEGATYTYAALAAQSRRLAATLSDSGAGEGERIGYLGGNSVAFLTTFLAAARMGAVFVPVNPRLTAPEVALILDDCAPHSLIVEPGHRQIVAEALAETDNDGVQLLWAPGDPVLDGPTTSPAFADGPLDERFTDDRSALQRCDADRVAMLTYTSGTTGRPKGVELTHGNLWWNGVNLDMVAPAMPGDITLVVAPLFHTAPFGCFTLRTLLRGGTVVLRRNFEPSHLLADLVDYRVNTVFAVPAMFAAAAAVPEFADADLSALRTAVTAGAPAHAELIGRYLDRGVTLQQAYGLTETLFATCLPAQQAATAPASAGLPLPYTEIRVIDPASRYVLDEPGARGEVCLRGPTVAGGYRNNDVATAAAFDADGWFHTGDVGYLDDDGCLYLVDRLKDMIIVGGDNVYSAEVEQVLGHFPGVVDVAVVGVPDPYEGESVVAIVLCENGTEPSLAELRRFAQTELARYKLPTRVVHAEKIPRNAMGKIDKVRIRAVLADGDEHRFSEAATGGPARTVGASEPRADGPRTLASLPPDEQRRAVFDLVAASIARTVHAAPATLTAQDRFDDLGLSSLAAVELSRGLGVALGRRLPTTVVFDHATVGALVKHLQTQLAAEARRSPALEHLTEFERVVRQDPPGDALRVELRTRLRSSLNRLAATQATTTRPDPVAEASDSELFTLLDAALGSV
ncbi:AMP-binding protein [Nocardia salmonicida]|uniref:AMP-binding protein n=1 Tax=Nocardia salmonicida TaxID=53431 RepID=UPI00366B2FC5